MLGTTLYITLVELWDQESILIKYLSWDDSDTTVSSDNHRAVDCKEQQWSCQARRRKEELPTPLPTGKSSAVIYFQSSFSSFFAPFFHGSFFFPPLLNALDFPPSPSLYISFYSIFWHFCRFLEDQRCLFTVLSIYSVVQCKKVTCQKDGAVEKSTMDENSSPHPQKTLCLQLSHPFLFYYFSI